MGKQYTIEEKFRAIKLYEETGHITYVINELGYPSELANIGPLIL